MRKQSSTTLTPPTILLVEDDPRSGPILSELLEEQGYRVNVIESDERSVVKVRVERII